MVQRLDSWLSWKTSDGETWVQVVVTSAFPARRSHTAIAFNRALYIFGGYANGYMKGDLWRSSTGESWTSISAPLGTARFYASFAIFAGRLYLLGGSQGIAGNYVTSNVYSSLNGATWVQAKNMPGAFAASGCVNYNGSVFVAAGAGVNGGYMSYLLRKDVIRLTATCNGTQCPNANFYLNTNAICASVVCNTAECCTPFTCAEVGFTQAQCSAGLVLHYNQSIRCPDGICTSAICCGPSVNCTSGGVFCDSNKPFYVERPNLQSIRCATTVCQPTDCCGYSCDLLGCAAPKLMIGESHRSQPVNESVCCANSCYGYVCGSGKVLLSLPWKIPCTNGPCNDQTCCSATTCSNTHFAAATCANHQTLPVVDMVVGCRSSTCSVDDCCESFWTIGPTKLPFLHRMWHTVTVINDRMVLIGGFRSDVGPLDDIWQTQVSGCACSILLGVIRFFVSC